MYLVINKRVTAVKVSNFSCHYLRNRSTLDIDVLGYIGIVQHKEHSPEVLSIPPGTPCIPTQHTTAACPIMHQQYKHLTVYTDAAHGEHRLAILLQLCKFHCHSSVEVNLAVAGSSWQ